MSSKRELIQHELDTTSQEVATLGVTERLVLFIVLQQIEAELSAGLALWLKEVPDVSAPVTRQQVRNVNKATRKATTMIRQSRPKMIETLGKAANSAVSMSDRHVTQQHRVFAGAHREGFGSKTPKPPAKPPTPKPPRKVTKLLIDKYPRSINKYAGELERHLRRQFELGHLRGESIDSMVKRILRLTPSRSMQRKGPVAKEMAQSLMRKARSDMARLIRTEAIYAYNTMQLEGIKGMFADDDTIRKRWDSSLDRRGCVICRGLDGEVQAVGDPFSTGVMTSPQHPHCFIPETKVQGAFVGALKSLYSGQVFELSVDSGRRLTVTPNHPILTGRGWIPANKLREGDDLFSYSGGDDDTTTSSSLNEEDQPPRIDQVFRLFRDAFSSTSVPASTGDLHGDASRIKGDVDVVDMNRVLKGMTNAEEASDFFNPLTNMLLFPISGDSTSGHPLDGLLSSSYGIMGGLSLLRSSGCGHTAPLQALGFGPASHLNTLVQKPSGEDASAYTRFVGELFERGAGKVVRDKLVKVRNFEFSGHVYDLQSVSGWLVANGIVASNCRCTVVAWSTRWKHNSMSSTGTEGIDAPDPKPFTRRSDQRAPAK